LPILREQLISIPVEEQDSHEQYSGKPFQSRTN